MKMTLSTCDACTFRLLELYKHMKYFLFTAAIQGMTLKKVKPRGIQN